MFKGFEGHTVYQKKNKKNKKQTDSNNMLAFSLRKREQY